MQLISSIDLHSPLVSQPALWKYSTILLEATESAFTHVYWNLFVRFVHQ